MNDIFQLNADVLGIRWPNVLARLLDESHEALPVELVEGQESTLGIDGVQLTSRHDRMGEARLQAASLPTSNAVIHVYGTGLGDLQQVLLLRSGLCQLHVHILNGALFLLVLKLTDQTSWLSDPRVELTYACDHRDIQLPFFALPAELELADERNARVRDRLVSEVHLHFNNREFDPASPHILERLQANLELVGSDNDVAQLFGTQPGRDIYVIGTGPTLEQHFDRLLGIRSRALRPLFICVDTAYRPLLAKGILPDIVVTIDRNISALHLPPAGSADVILVYKPLSDPAVISAWEGERYVAYSTGPLHAPLRKQFARGELSGGGSVIHPAVDLAVQMGAREITLLGADFAYPMNRTHAGWDDGMLGAPADQSRQWVLDGHGQRIKTQLNFRRYLGELERYIEAHPEVQFLNSSRSGAMIAGTVFNDEFVS
ncbi:motility associated factor glycosyltransferase family protein [Pseudomonas sp. CDFA 602]|uniref:motility associated factor glycosyltransferase family protein n=1 Tax=Pseudomonas californiensis TaxID=2829823 RepID=UPI001E64442E|nr:6-hydroxymethylpterin diphosphokinase MptE-like protein [Pseudomonas californiensis]MCD5992992.1 motility associated factor glycosyltransferase family protein [Pseudomonas californiensis]MCD5998369.1 motility associated factor glycosyltransferase family protein [Pseudomonas californiensis]